jgi:hypothetical protein
MTTYKATIENTKLLLPLHIRLIIFTQSWQQNFFDKSTK